MTNSVKTILYPVTDADKAKALFTSLIGAPPTNDSPYYIGWTVEGQEIGLVPNGHKNGMTAATPYWHVADIEATLSALRAGGATDQQAVRNVGGGRLVASVTDPDGNSENFLTSKPVKFTNTLGTQVSCIQVGTLKFANGVSLDDILGCLAGVGLNPGDRAGVLTGSLIVSDADKKINSSATVNGTAPGQPKQGGNFFVASELQRLQF